MPDHPSIFNYSMPKPDHMLPFAKMVKKASQNRKAMNPFPSGASKPKTKAVFGMVRLLEMP